jgi:hypothetical protein
MSLFRIQNVYSEKTDNDLDSESEFRINSNVSDINLLKLQQNLKKLNSKKMQCNLTDTIIVL